MGSGRPSWRQPHVAFRAGGDVLVSPVLKEPGFSATSNLTPSCLPQPWWLEGANGKPRDELAEVPISFQK